MNSGTDVAVLGAGIVGLATAYALRERGASVSVYDRSEPGSGQSGGDARIFRHAHRDRRLVALARESLAVYRRWEEELGTEFVSRDGAVFIGAEAASRLAVIEDVGGIAASLVDGDELAARMPLLARRDEPVLFDADAGAIRAAAAIGALSARLARDLVSEEVVAVWPLPEGTVEVRTGGGRAEHGAAVVCAGASTAAIARGLGLSIPLELTLHGRVTFNVRGDAPGPVACLQDGSEAFGEPGAYGVASPGSTRFSIGVAETPAHEDASLLEPAELGDVTGRAAAYVAKALPGLDPSPAAHRHCWVTTLPWDEDGIGVWAADSIHLLAGNNLFKHAPALGEALAEAALGRGLRDDLRPAARLGAVVA